MERGEADAEDDEGQADFQERAIEFAEFGEGLGGDGEEFEQEDG